MHQVLSHAQSRRTCTPFFALLERFSLLPYRDLILAQAAPCISMVLDEPADDDEPWPELPAGLSKVGGVPDLPPSLRWPFSKGYRAGFFYREKHAADIDREAAAWRQIMRLDSNPVTTYMSPCDAALVYVMTGGPGTRAWAPNAKVYGLATK